MEQNLNELTRLAFDAAPIGIVLAEQRVIRTCNRTFASMLGYEIKELVGQSFRMFYGSDEEFEATRDIGLMLLQQTGRYSDERFVQHRAGHALWCRFRAHTLSAAAPLAHVVMSFAQINEAAPVSLTKRERQVLGLMNQRLTSKEIANHLGLSPRTIDDVRGRLIKRFGVKRATDLLGRMRGLG
jgi:PAS domain S-box-containing protein